MFPSVYDRLWLRETRSWPVVEISTINRDALQSDIMHCDLIRCVQSYVDHYTWAIATTHNAVWRFFAHDRSRPVTTGYDRLRPVTTGYDRLRPVTTGYDRLRPVTTGYDYSRLLMPTHDTSRSSTKVFCSRPVTTTHDYPRYFTI